VNHSGYTLMPEYITAHQSKQSMNEMSLIALNADLISPVRHHGRHRRLDDRAGQAQCAQGRVLEAPGCVPSRVCGGSASTAAFTRNS